MAPKLPQHFGQYTLNALIARGGMAEVYRATTQGIGGFEKTVAVKKILPHLAENEEFITMLIDEARIVVSLNHANIAQVFDLGVIDDTYYIAMEYVHGIDVDELLRRMDKRNQRVPVEHAVFIASAVCAGLHVAHAKVDEHGRSLHIVHRDVSPHNILISYAGDVKIIDFGVAKAKNKETHTKMGVIKGKLLYMAPEQAMAKEIDGRADIFAAGLILYRMLTGVLPFGGENEFQIYNNILNKEIVPPRLMNPNVPDELDQIVMKILERDPNLRFQDGYAAKSALDRVLHSIAPGYSVGRLGRFIEDNFMGPEPEAAPAAAPSLSAMGSARPPSGRFPTAPPPPSFQAQAQPPAFSPGSSGQFGAAGASGQFGAAGASGQFGAAGASGQFGAAGSSGQFGAAGASGQFGAAGSSGQFGAFNAHGAQTVEGDSLKSMQGFMPSPHAAGNGQAGGYAAPAGNFDVPPTGQTTARGGFPLAPVLGILLLLLAMGGMVAYAFVIKPKQDAEAQPTPVENILDAPIADPPVPDENAVAVAPVDAGVVLADAGTSDAGSSDAGGDASTANQDAGADVGPEMVEFKIASTPAGAKIFVDGKESGETPALLALPLSETEVSIRLEAEGYEPKTLSLTPDSAKEESVELAKVEVKAPPKPKTRKPRKPRKPKKSTTKSDSDDDFEIPILLDGSDEPKPKKSTKKKKSEPKKDEEEIINPFDL